MKRDILFGFSLFFLIFLVIFAIFGPHFRHSYENPIGFPHLAMGAVTDTIPTWLGTDEQGRDIMARLAQGARLSLFIGLTVTSIGLTIGTLMGVAGVYAPRWLSEILMRFTDAMFAFPPLLLAILIVGIWDTTGSSDAGMTPVIVALAFSAWPHIARLVKNQVESLKDREYIIAARALGASTPYIVIKHVLPQLWGILLAVSIIDIAGVILSEGTLSFLGIGVQAPEPSWGSMINTARNDMNSHPMMLLWPCLILSLTIFSLNFVGEGLRARIDPKRKARGH
jgi:ABC-type dipeptide/oligopeptide/nickel transport system permease subunit